MTAVDWTKRGAIYCPSGASTLEATHAMVPTPLLLQGGTVIRVFYTALDADGVGRPFYVDVDASDPTRVIGRSTAPLMDIGRPGTFDDNGALITSVVHAADGVLYAYYVGFELGRRIRYRLLTGLARSVDGGATFERLRETPILERSDAELYFRGGPFVLNENGRFRMWYVAGSRWTELQGKSMPEYRVMYLESGNGLDWADRGRLVLDITDADEHGFGRPYTLRKPDGGYAHFYSIRRRSLMAYRMGYAESGDGVTWVRDDARINLEPGPGSEDDTAIMYAAPIVVGSKLLCFYNGNDFGKTGILLAERNLD